MMTRIIGSFYLASQTLAGRASDITEAELAAEVFSRGADFDPASDTIVRSHMLRLRQRLAQPSPQNARFSVNLPKGQYALEFEKLAQPELLAPEAPSAPTSSFVIPGPSPAILRRGCPLLLHALLSVLLIAVGYDVYLHIHRAATIRKNLL
jgi:hypothetical protein